MTRYTSSRPCEWVQPRSRGGLTRDYIDPPLQGMDSDRLTVGQFIAWVGTLAGLCVVVALFAAVV